MRLADLAALVVAVLAVAWTAVLARLAPVAGVAARLRRPPVLIGSVLATALLAAHPALADAVEDRTGVAAWDGPVMDWLAAHRTGQATALLGEVSAVGGTAGMAVVTAVVAMLLFLRGHRELAVVLVVGAFSAAALTTGLKDLYARSRPPAADQLVPETNYSLPSGHALGSVVVLGLDAMLAVLLARRAVLRVAAVVVALAAVLTIGASRLYLGVHWLTDVAAAWAVGGAWLAVCCAAAVLVHAAPAARVDPRVRASRLRCGLSAGWARASADRTSAEARVNGERGTRRT